MYSYEGSKQCEHCKQTGIADLHPTIFISAAEKEGKRDNTKIVTLVNRTIYNQTLGFTLSVNNRLYYN